VREELATVQRDLEASRVIRSELALELANATTNRKLAEERLETERLRAEELIKQIEEKETAIANLQTELDNRLAEAARNEIFLTEELERFKYGIQPGEDGDTPANPASPQNTQDLKTLIKTWKRQSKSTRDWTKANQLISELENLL